MKSATGKSPRLPISTRTCTPSDSQAPSDSSASPRANSVATSGPDPNDQRSRDTSAPNLIELTILVDVNVNVDLYVYLVVVVNVVANAVVCVDRPSTRQRLRQRLRLR